MDLLLPVDTNVDNGAAYVNPAFQHGNASSPTGKTAPCNNDTSYDFVTGALAMMQGTSGADPDHAALVNATYAGMPGAGTEDSYADVTGSTNDTRFSFVNATYAGLDGNVAVAEVGFGGTGGAEATYADMGDLEC